MAFTKKGNFKEITGYIAGDALIIKDKYNNILRVKVILYGNLKKFPDSNQKIELFDNISELIGTLIEDVQWQIFSVKSLRVIINRLKRLLEETSTIPSLEKQIETTFEDIEDLFSALQQVYIAQLKLLNAINEKENFVRELRSTLVSELDIYKSYNNLKNRLSKEKRLLIKKIPTEVITLLNTELLRAGAILTYIIKKAPHRI